MAVINEWNLLRTIACLSIVFLHSMTMVSRINEPSQIELFTFLQIILCYATPTFLVLSAIILSNQYPQSLPSGFWKKRFKWIYVPFLFFGFIDALVLMHKGNAIILSDKLINNMVFGLYEGWFVLVIFQFYILHFLVIHLKVSMKWIVPISLVTMILYLNILNGGHPFVGEYKSYLKIAFFAWIGYFSIAFIIGKYYKGLAKTLKKYRWLTLLSLIVSVLLIYYNYQTGFTSVNSRRWDLIPLVFSVTMFVIAWGQSVPSFRVVSMISNYSFGIYLVHWQLQRYITDPIVELFPNIATQVVGLFIASVILSIITIKLVSLLPFGSYLVGKVKKAKPKEIIGTKEVAKAS